MGPDSSSFHIIDKPGGVFISYTLEGKLVSLS